MGRQGMCVPVGVYVRVHEFGDDRLPVGDLSNQGVVLLVEFLHPAEGEAETQARSHVSA
jgi:hypothetical protein